MTKENVRCGLRLSDVLNRRLSIISREIGMTKNQLMVKILWEWVKHNPPAPEERGGGHE